MSRYNKSVINEDGQLRELNWGFDHALGYYYDITDPTIEEKHGVIEEWSSTLGYTGKHPGKDGKSRSTMLEFLIKYDLPEEQKSLVGMDMPL
jgi:hypothetical protein